MRMFPIPEAWAERVVRIDLIGAGGTGSQVADQLASMETTLRALGHPGFEVIVYDGDMVTNASVGRSRYTPADVGHPKAVLLAHRIGLFYNVAWQAVPEHHRGSTNADLVITCVDSALFRAGLGKQFSKRSSESLWLDFGNGDHQAQVILGHLGKPNSERRLPNVFDLFPELEHMAAADREAPSCSAEEAIRRQPWPINRVVATLGMELLWTLFRNGSISHHGYTLTLNPLITTHMPIDPAVWEFYGYQCTRWDPITGTRQKRASKRAKKAATRAA